MDILSPVLSLRDSEAHPEGDAPARQEEASTRKKLNLDELLMAVMKVETDLMQAREVLTEQGHSSSPEVIQAILDEISNTTLFIEVAIKKNEGPDFSAVCEKYASWGSLVWIVDVLLRMAQAEANKLPKIKSSNIGVLLKKNIALASVVPNLKYYLEDFKTLNKIFPTILEITFGQPNEKEMANLLLSSYNVPFWYAFQAQTRTFRDVINLMKATFASSHSQSNVFLKAFAVGSAAVKGAVSPAERRTMDAHELLRKGASVELVRAMWNIPESGIGAFATKMSNPSITTAEKFFLAVPEELEKKWGFEQIEVLVLCHKKLPFPFTKEIPLNWTGLRCKPPQLPDHHDGKHLIIHFHGGGFLASTPYSHEPYLRPWVNACGAMMLSCNYTKSPEKQYPYSLNECYFLYTSAIDYFQPTKVVVSGDSAGGNLCLAVTLKAAAEGIRVPDGILASYPAVDVSLSATPSRVLFGHDIMLPADILTLALDSYLPTTVDGKSDPFASPLRASDDLLKKLPDSSCFLSANLDPLLDDTSRFLVRMRAVGKHPQWHLYDLPHGFLNFAAILPTAAAAIKQGAKYLEQFFQLSKS